MSGHHRQPRSGRRKRDLLRTIAEQREYIDLCEKTISRLSDERDHVVRERDQLIRTRDGLDDTVIMPIVPLEPPTHTIPIVLPDGRVLRTEPGRRHRPAWAHD